MDRIDEAVRKIAEEKTRFKGGRKEQAVKDEVAEALTRFVRQDAEFAQAVVQADGTLSDCCAAAMKGVGTCISDLKLYQKAVQFYFPGADIRCQMTIDLCASVHVDAETNPVPVQMDKPPRKAGVLLDLTDFL